MSDEIKALVERARRNAGWRNEKWQCITDPALLEELAAALTAQADEITQLRARLEITDEITERYDGIACRDETIRLLEQKIAALKAAQEVGRDA